MAGDNLEQIADRPDQDRPGGNRSRVDFGKVARVVIEGSYLYARAYSSGRAISNHFAD